MSSTTTTSAAVASAGTPARKSWRTVANFWVDLLTALAFALLLATSFLMKYILPPGSCDGEVVKSWFGHARHWWGDIHFIVAIAMIVLIIVHIWLHWSWVTGTWTKLLGSLKSPATWVALVVMAGVMVVPWIIPPEVVIEAPAQESAAGTPDTPAGNVAPCGVEGLSCADCPASSDRLFGGSCTAADENAPVDLGVLAHGFESAGEETGAGEGEGSTEGE